MKALLPAILALTPMLTEAQPAPGPNMRPAIVRTITGQGRGDGRLSTNASVIQVAAMAQDSVGNLYVVDQFDHRVRRIDARTGIISTVMGTGIAGNGPDGGIGPEVALNFPSDLAIDSQDRVIVADTFNFLLRRFDPRTRRVEIIAGDGFCCNSDDGTLATQASLSSPLAVHVAANQDIYLSEGSTVRRINAADGTIERVAGVFGMFFNGGDGGSALSATFQLSGFITSDDSGRIYVADTGARTIRMIDLAQGTIETLELRDASSGAAISLPNPRGMVYDRSRQELLLAQDPGFYAIDVETGAATLTDLDLISTNSLTLGVNDTVIISHLARQVFELDRETKAQTPIITAVQPAECSEALDSALLFNPKGLALGPDGLVYVSDQGLGFVAKIDEIAGAVTSVAGQRGVLSNDLTDDGGPATLARLAVVVDIAFDARGRLLIATARGVRRVNTETQVIETVVGGGDVLPDRTDDPTMAFFPDLRAMVVDGLGRYYIAQPNVVFRVSADGTQLERYTGILGGGFSGDGGPALAAELSGISGMAADAVGNLFIVDQDNNRIRRVDAESGIIETVAGSGEFFPPGDGGLATAAGLTLPQGVALSLNGTQLFIADSARIRRVDLNSGIIDTIAGTGESGTAGDGGPARLAQLNVPIRMAQDRAGNLFFTELGRQRVRVVEQLGSAVRLPIETDQGDEFGRAIAASGDRFAVGMPRDGNVGNGRGSVAIYVNDNCQLRLEDRVVPPIGLNLERFGRSVALDGNRLLVGSGMASEGDKGAQSLQAALFERLGQDWRFKQPITAQAVTADDDFGAAVSIDGDVIAIGAPGTDNETGAVYVFELDGNQFSESATVSGTESGDLFGAALDLKNDRMAVGAPGAAISTGSASLYDQVTTNLSLSQTFRAPDGSSSQEFGASIAIEGDLVLVGAPASDDGGLDTGSAYLFDFDGANSVVQLTVSDLQEGAKLGSAVDLDQAVAFVGAPGLSDESGGSGGVFGFSVDDLASVAKGSSSSALQKISPLFYQQGLGASVAVSDGRGYSGAPETGDNRGDAVALQLLANLGAAAGLWFDPASEGDGFNVIASSVGTIVYFFGYTREGERLWLVSDLIPELSYGAPISVDMFDSRGGTFDAPVASAEGVEPWGRAQIELDTIDSGVIELFGADGEKVSRSVQLAGTRGDGAEFAGLWFDPGKDGEGYNVIASDFGVIVYFYGFSASGERLWLVSDLITDPIGSAPTQVTLFEAQGGNFATPAPSSESLRNWGTLTVTFSGCNDATFELAGSDGAKTSSAVRLADIVGQSCE